MARALDHFVTAQNAVWDDVLAELAAGAKRSHWIWFVFPQIAGLGRRATSATYAIADLAEARRYLAHPVLGPRLRQATEAMLRRRGTPARTILGDIDATKFRSSMTLFAAAAPDEGNFAEALAAFFDGPDPLTLARLPEC